MNNVEQHQHALQCARQSAKEVLEETMNSISVASELNNSTKVLDKLDEISNKLTELIQVISVLSLQTVTTQQVIKYQQDYTVSIDSKPIVNKREKKEEKPFIPQIDTSNMDITLNDSKKNTKSSSKNIMDSLNALNNLK